VEARSRAERGVTGVVKVFKARWKGRGPHLLYLVGARYLKKLMLRRIPPW
jgi:hypothetical protein